MGFFPAIRNLQTQTLHSLEGKSSFVVGRNPEADLPIQDVNCSRQQFRISQKDNLWMLEALSVTSPTTLNGKPLASPMPIYQGALIEAGNSRFCFLLENDSSPTPQTQGPILPPAPPRTPIPDFPERNVTQISSSATDESPLNLLGNIPLKGTQLIGREEGRADIVLSHPHVSRLHAQIHFLAGKATVVDLRSANGTFLNGQRITQQVPLKIGDRIDIGPYSLVFQGNYLQPQSRENNVELVGHRLTKKVTDKSTGIEITLLDQITLVVRPHEFVAILGPSGSGKSTLLGALSARSPANEGQVLLNGKSLYGAFESFRQDMVVVPQKDLHFDSLTVEQSLKYTAKLRLPPDTQESELNLAVDQMLETVGLSHKRKSTIRTLSGGQLKRASLATELISKPTLLFLDEVTSGLDQQTDREMMALFRSLAESGKTLLCVTHNLANVESSCHLVIILTTGGKMAFLGTPAEALKHFGVRQLGDIYEKLSEKSPEAWEQQFQASPFHSRYIESRLPRQSVTPANGPESIQKPFQEWAKDTLWQSKVLIHRYKTLILADRQNILMLVFNVVLIAIFLWLLFGNIDASSVFERSHRSTMLNFMMVTFCFWFGCNNAARELVKEREIFQREVDFNLSGTAYYLSKFLVLTGITIGQNLLLWLLVLLFCHPATSILIAPIVFILISITGVALGLAISAMSKTTDVAVSTIPLVLIPQIIFGDSILPLAGFAKFLGQTTISVFWGAKALNSTLPENILKTLPDHQKYPLWVSILILIIHALVFGFVGFVFLARSGKVDLLPRARTWINPLLRNLFPKFRL